MYIKFDWQFELCTSNKLKIETHNSAKKFFFKSESQDLKKLIFFWIQESLIKHLEKIDKNKNMFYTDGCNLRYRCSAIYGTWYTYV